MRYVAFLRGINIGGRRATGPELVAAVTAAGMRDPVSFLASGNVVFDSDAPAAGLEPAIEAALEAEFDFAVGTIVRSADELQVVAAAEPFEPMTDVVGKPQVVLTKDPLTAPIKQQIAALATDLDQLVIDGDRCFYWFPVNGVAESELNFKQLDALCGLTTVRTHNTMHRLTKKFF